MTNIEDTTKPLASIFIPTYNGGRFLAQAIDSVLAQTYSDYELIILDDGSTDNTPTVLRQYESHPKIRIYTNPQNMGMAPNWNLGLSLCRGKYVAKLDVDDYYEPDYLETVISFFETHPDVGLVFSGLNLIYPDGRREPEIPFLRSWVKTREAFLPNLLQSCMIRSPTICVRKTCYDRLGGFIESMRLHPDWEMWVRISANCAVGYIARRLANYRMSYGQNCTSQSITQGWSIQDIQLWLELLASNKLPYQFNTKEDFYFRWGIYNLEMQFAAIAADHHEEAIRQQYIDFAESALPYQESKAELEEMRVTYAHLHQGIYAFRENKLAEACQYFFAAVKPQHLSQIRLKLTLSYKVIWRVAADLFYYYFVKYCPGL